MMPSMPMSSLRLEDGASRSSQAAFPKVRLSSPDPVAPVVSTSISMAGICLHGLVTTRTDSNTQDRNKGDNELAGVTTDEHPTQNATLQP